MYERSIVFGNLIWQPVLLLIDEIICCYSRNFSPTSMVLSVLSQLVSDLRSRVFMTRRSGHEVLPLGQCGRAAVLVCLSVDEMALQIEVVMDVGMYGGELL